MTTKELRERAAQEIERRGWCQRSSTDPAGRVCLMKALSLADDAAKDGGEACFKAYDELYAEVGVPSGLLSLAKWNDAPERTKDEVIARLRGVSA